MWKRLLFLALAFLFVMQSISAVDTQVKIKTFPYHEVQATIYDSSAQSFTVLEGGRFKGDSDKYGDFSFVFSTDKLEFNIIVYIKKDGETVLGPEKFLNKVAGEPLELRIAPEGFQLPETPSNETEQNITANETIENETQDITESSEGSAETTEDSQENRGLAGSVIFGEEGIFSKNVLYYILGGIILVALLVFVGLKIEKKRALNPKEPKEVKIRKLSDIKSEEVGTYKKEMGQAEKKMQEMQREINRLKNEGKIKEIESRIQQEQEEIKRLRRGE